MKTLLALLLLLSATPARAADAPSTSAPATSKNSAFPIAVWLQDPRNAPKFQALGINTYVGLWDGPTADQLATLEKAGMPVICAQNAEALKPRWNHEIIAWMHGDEPDNAQSLGAGKGYGPPIPPEKIAERYAAMKAADPTRPIMLNLGQGVAWDNWIGRGIRSHHPEDYPLYIKAGDIISFDIYPITHDNPEVAGKLWYVGYGTQRLTQWTAAGEAKKTVWACIECTHISNPRLKPTPDQVKSEVWQAITHGAHGLIYFVHQFAPRFIEAGLLADPDMMHAITQINRQLQDLAPALLSDPPAVQATTDQKDAIAILTRRQGDTTYIFTVGNTEATLTATLSLPGLTGPLEVLGENRTLAATSGQWHDTFTAYQVHLYRTPPATP